MSKPSDDRKPAENHKKRAQRRGLWAEGLARLYLRLHGRRILAHNFKTPVGEIDIIARRGNLISFVEVKARKDAATAALAIHAHQQGRIIRAAQVFLLQNPALGHCDIRFDVALVSGPLSLTYMADAWSARVDD
ncbi:MAG: YraN family protein [Rhodospirillales bacterium]|nr:YraN family protein [Rhodospirillales bacterium]